MRYSRMPLTRRYPGHQAAPSWWRARDSWDFLLMAGKVGHTPFLRPLVLILSSLRISVTWHHSLGFSQSRWEGLQRPCLTLLSFSSVYVSALEHLRSPALNTPISPDSSSAFQGILSPSFSRNVFDVVKNSFINSVSNARLETARRNVVFGLERNEYRKSILWGLTINLCRLRRHLTHKFPFLIVKEAAQRACIFGVENSQHLCPGPPVACLGATWIKETLRCVFRCQQKKTS